MTAAESRETAPGRTAEETIDDGSDAATAGRLQALSDHRRALVERMLIQRRRASGDDSIPARQVTGPVPVSFGQQRVWFTSLLDPAGSLYNTVTTVSLPTPVDLGALRRALAWLIRRHASLRTVFVDVDGEPFQHVLDDLPVEIGVDIADVQAFVRRPFDLTAGPLLRTCLSTRSGVLVVCVHHIVTDGWSMGIFVRELQASYAAELRGERAPLAPLRLQYTDFAAWQRTELSAHRLNSLEEFWRGELAGVAPLDVRTARRRPPRPAFDMSAVPVRIPGPLLAGLRAVASQCSATLFMTMLAVYATLLSRYAGSDDIAVGTPVAGRDRRDFEGIIGFFVNTVVLRCSTSDDPTFRALVSRMREMSLRAFGHADMPFERLVEIIQPERDLGRNPICQVVLHLIDAAPDEWTDDATRSRGAVAAGVSDGPPAVRTTASSTGSLTRRDQATQGSSPFDLVLFLRATPDGLAGELQFRTELFSPSLARRLAADLVALVQSLVSDPDRPIGAASLRADGQSDAAPTLGRPPALPSAMELVCRQARATPDAPAVGHTSYAELISRASAVARRLSHLGVSRESLVGVCLPRGVELVASQLGTWLAGGAFLAIDPAVPKARNDAIVADARPVVVIDQAWLANRVAGDSGGRVDGARMLADEVDSSFGGSNEPGQLAYVIYTSGSSGAPKGVEVEHGSLANLVDWHIRRYGLEPTDRASLTASPSFDASVWEIWPYLAAGASLHPVPPDVLAPHAILDWLAGQRITMAFLATPMAEAILAERLPTALRLRYVLTGGDQLRVRPPAGTPFAVANHYGPTEATVLATAGVVDPEGSPLPSIGQPIDNVVVEIVDAAGRTLPSGLPGELWIGGRNVARGYLHREQLTADRFPSRGGERFYRSGDLALWRDDGELEFLGRLDDQLKIRGFRIEPAEIEGQLLDHPAVSLAAVAEHDGLLVGYVVVRSGAGRSPAVEQHRLTTEFQSLLGARLPRHMVPSHFEFLAEMPLTTSGKIDRRALPAPAERRSDQAAGRVEPRTRMEADLQVIFAGLLRRPSVGVNENFFELGGHSLLAAQLISRVRTRLGRELPISAVFDAPTISGMARLMEDAGAAPARPAITRRPRAQFQATLRPDGTVRVDDRLREVLNLPDVSGARVPGSFGDGSG